MVKMKHLVIIPIYNRPQLAKKCIESILRTTDLKKNKVVLVDDGSKKYTKQMLNRYQEKGFEVVLNKNNKGKPRRVNEAMHKYPKMDYYTILDSDIEIITKNWIGILLKAHKDWQNKVILGGYSYMTGYSFKKKGITYLDPWPFWNLAGCFFSFSQKVFKEVGYFHDQSYRHEDADYCRRAYLAGFKWFYIKDIKAKITGKKTEQEKARIRKKQYHFGDKAHRRWADQVMTSHNIYYKPKFK